MTPLSDLIARLEAAKEGSRELDGDIAVVLSLYPQNFRRGVPEWNSAIWWNDPGKLPKTWEAPAFTTSLDAALTLVPEECVWGIVEHHESDKEFRAGIFTERHPGGCTGEWLYYGYGFQAEANTPALALCIAALKAREAGR